MFDWFDALNSYDESNIGDTIAPAVSDYAAPAAADGAIDMSGFRTGATNDAAQYFGNNAGGSYGSLGSGFSGLDATSMGDLFNTNANLGSGLGDALGYGKSASDIASGSDSWLGKLGDQVGDKLFNKKDPLSSVATMIGILSQLRNATGHAPSDLPKVQALFDQGNASPYKAPNVIQTKAPIAVRPASSFIAPTGALSLIRR